ncbi:MAG: PKD domain-containing protein [Thermoplasmatota archaeon]
MRSSVIAFILISLLIGVSLFSFVGTTLADDGHDADNLIPTRAGSNKQDDYPVFSGWDDENYNEPWNQRWHNWSNYLPYYEQREFWLQCKNVSDEYQWLDDVYQTNNGEEIGLAKEDLNETRKYNNPMNFSYPRTGKTLTAKYDHDMNDMGVLNFTINPMGQIPQLPFQNPNMGKFKELNVEVWIDTNGDYDFEEGTGSIEGIMKFDFDWWNTPYDPLDPEGTIDPHVTNSSAMWRTLQQMEEHVDGLGYWIDIDDDGKPNLPGDINGGRIWTILYRTDDQPDDVDGQHPITGEPWLAWWTWDMLIYCGYEQKLSWITIPYIHPKQVPVADMGEDLGFPANRENWQNPKSHPDYEDPIFNDEYPQIKEGEILRFDASTSFDPQDDVGMDGIGYGDPDWIAKDSGEDNGNIDDGFPEGEPDLGEEDTLQYKWSGAVVIGGITYHIQIAPNWQDSPIFEWKVRLPAMDPNLPAEDQWLIVNITLTVLDVDRNQGSTLVQLLAYKSQHSPIVQVGINPQIPNWEDFDKSNYVVLDGSDGSPAEAWILENSYVEFNGYATDIDPNSVLSYYWEFIGPYTSIQKQETIQVTETFQDPGDWIITLTVFDGPRDNLNTMSGNDTLILHVVENTNPVPVIRAKDARSNGWKYEHINTTKGLTVTFNGSDSYDPDVFVRLKDDEENGKYVGLPGFDEDDDYTPDVSLKYQWDWGDNSRTEGWSISPEAEKVWFDKGSRAWNKQFWPVTLKVWDGADIVESIPYKVFVNLPPTAEAGPVLPLPGEPEIEVGHVVWFDGSGSYDPNDDADFDLKRDSSYVDRLNYVWDFGDGSPQVEGRRVNHTYSSPDIAGWKVRLTVSDGTFTDVDETLVKVHPANKLPIGKAIILFDEIVSEGVVLTNVKGIFDATESYDPDGTNFLDNKDETKAIDDFISLYWNLGDGTITSNPYVEHQYTEDGVYNVTLNMTDSKGGFWTETTLITVMNRKPIPIAKTDSITMYKSKQPVMLSGEGSYDLDGEVIGYYWDFGDGTYSDRSEGIDGYAPGMVVPHTYDNPGNYKAELRVMDDDHDRSDLVAEVNVVILAEGGKDQPVDPAVIIGGIAATTILLSILSGLGVAFYRKRL